jgi:hypothetical protein
MKRLIVSFELSLILKIIYKCTKHHNYLQTHLHLIPIYLQALKLLKTHMHKPKVIRTTSLIKAWIKLKVLIVLGLMK